MSLSSQRIPWCRVGAELALAAVLAGAVWASHHGFTYAPHGVELLWLPSGLAVGAVLCCGLRHLPGLLLGLAAGAVVHAGMGDGALGVEGAGVLLEVAFALAVTRYARFDPSFAGLREIGLFLGGVVVAAPVVALSVVFLLDRLGGGSLPGWGALALQTGSHMAGIGTVAPVMILSRRWGPPRLPTLRGVIRALLQVLGPALLLANAFGPVHPGGSLLALMLPLPLAAVLVVSFGLAAAVEAVLLMDLTLVALTARGLGFFGGQDDWSALLGLGSHMTLLTAMTLTLGGIKRQRQRAERVAAAAMQEAGVALWIWISGRGLILHDPEWAACFGVAAGVPATPEQIDAATHPEDRLSLRLWCASDEAPPAAGVEEFRMKGSDGCWHWVTSRRLHAIPGFPPAEGTLYGVFQDLTEHKEMERVRLEATRQEAELRNLKLSIQPHFLFNSLNSLRSLIASRPAEAREFVTRLAAFLHTAVADAGEDLLPLARSLAVVETYLAIERTRFGDRLRVSEAIAPEARGAAFPPLILQTLVENALKYGVAKRPEGGEIRIEATVSEGWLRVAVVNDGCIVPAPAHALGTGLKSAERRVKLLFGEAASVRLREDATPRVTAEVVVPLRLVASPAASPTFP